MLRAAFRSGLMLLFKYIDIGDNGETVDGTIREGGESDESCG